MAEETVQPEPDVCTIRDLMEWLSSRSESHAFAFAETSAVRAAVDKKVVSNEAVVEGASEIAFFPPMTGG